MRLSKCIGSRTYHVARDLLLAASLAFAVVSEGNCQQPEKGSAEILKNLRPGDRYWIAGSTKTKYKGSNICAEYPCRAFTYLNVPLHEQFEILEIFPSTSDTDRGDPWLKLRLDSGTVGYISFHYFFHQLRQDVRIEGRVSESDFNRYTDKQFIASINPDDYVSTFREKLEKRAQAELQAELSAEAEKRRAQKERDARGSVRLGMTKAQVLKSSWGKPNSVNRTTTSGRVHEQWVYVSQQYLYFENNKLVAVQQSE